MTFAEYIPLAVRTESPRSSCSEQNRLLHASIGSMTESVELMGFTDQSNLVEELGDICWYIAIALDTLKPASLESKLVPMATGLTEKAAIRAICDESAVMLDSVKKWMFYGKQVDRVDFVASCNVVLHLIRELCNMRGIQFCDVLKANIRKLEVRYPEKFSDLNASSRDLEAEKKALF